MKKSELKQLIREEIKENYEDRNTSSIKFIQNMSQEILTLLNDIPKEDFEQRINQWLDSNKNTRLGLAVPTFTKIRDILKTLKGIVK